MRVGTKGWVHGLSPFASAWLVLWASMCTGHAQIDPVKRDLIQLGFNQPTRGKAPISGYAFYLLNRPDFPRTNLTLRLALAPTFLDSELGFREALGPNTDVGLGVAGGGFAHTYSEFRRGTYLQAESFTGHGGELSASLYHRFNPNAELPLHGVLRAGGQFVAYERDDQTAAAFTLPRDRATAFVRAGLRLGGGEPVIFPDLGLELSVWAETQLRDDDDTYGFGRDRRVEATSHLFWARAVFTYTLPNLQPTFSVHFTGGGTIRPDRFSAWRLGGYLPMVSEFPLTLPGYFYQELTAERFFLAGGHGVLPMDSARRWNLVFIGSGGWVDYLRGLEQPGSWHSGVGTGLHYRSASGRWQVGVGGGYGFQALRNGHKGAFMVGMICEINFAPGRAEGLPPQEKGTHPSGLFRWLWR